MVREMGGVSMIKFSIVVPIYNVEKYLPQCIESVLAQTYKNFELILVNDGSTDTSKEICENYQRKDSRIKLINKFNEGLPAARNTGINTAKGDYLMHLDGDDFWHRETLKNIYELIGKSKVDICFGNSRNDFYSENKVVEKIFFLTKEIENYSSEELIRFFMNANHDIPIAAWHNAYRLDFLNENKIRYDGTLTWGEDTDVFYNILDKFKTYSVIDFPFYFYRKDNANAMTKVISKKNLLSNIQVIEKWSDYYREKSTINPQVKDDILLKLSNTYLYLTTFISQVNKADRKDVLNRFNSAKIYFSYISGISNYYYYIGCKIFGFKFMSLIYHQIKKR